MSFLNMYFAEGFEEVEALTVVDLLRRAGIRVDMVSISGDLVVKGSHGIRVVCDRMFDDAEEADGLILPGGMPGTTYLKEHKGLDAVIRDYDAKGKLLAAICAAPTVFGEMGLLKDREACCYPGLEPRLLRARVSHEPVTVCGNLVTSRGVGTAIAFALEIITILTDKKTADEIAYGVVYTEQDR